ncbi:MAG: hypothetical protein HOK72_02065 [Flavobacteriales bacterium]|jgi:hypothetical protein|nr:hypothetical protein [Flavobacteriales bacterium]
MSPFSPVSGIIIYAFGFVFSMAMFVVSLLFGSVAGALISVFCAAGFIWGYQDCIEWSKKWSENE